MLWECAECGYSCHEHPKGFCSRCGLVQMGPGTHEKYEILEKYCYPLSLIMRNQGFKHNFIDACAGSGIVQEHTGKDTLDGSPLIFAKTKDIVQERIKNKSKQPHIQCKFIEFNKKAFNILQRELEPYDDFCDLYHGDCNDTLPKILDDVDRTFSFIYIDPFGLGEPVIKYETIQQVLGRGFTELFIHFSWQGVSRTAGLLSNIDHYDEKKKKIARSAVKTLDSYLTPQWQEIQEKAKSSYERRKRFVTLYESNLKQYYPEVKYVEIPMGSNNPYYYLFFTTRNKTGYKIMAGIIDNLRRKGSKSLYSYH